MKKYILTIILLLCVASVDTLNAQEQTRAKAKRETIKLGEEMPHKSDSTTHRKRRGLTPAPHYP